jgi:hypothetical protein
MQEQATQVVLEMLSLVASLTELRSNSGLEDPYSCRIFNL